MKNEIINDNSKLRERYKEEPMTRFLPYIPLAQRLIENYVHEYWKNDKDDYDYSLKEYGLAHDLYYLNTRDFKDDTLEWIAKGLNVSTLTLYNDKSLPFYGMQDDTDILAFKL